MELIAHFILDDDRRVGMLCLEIIECPSIHILSQFSSPREAHEGYHQEMTSLLSQIAREFVSSKEVELPKVEMSLELCYITTPVANQPYTAAINCFIIVRAIGANDQLIDGALVNVRQRIESLFRSETYTYRTIDCSGLAGMASHVGNASAKAVVREDRIHRLQSPTLPECFSYDRLATTDFARKGLFNDMTLFPNCCISFQLIPVMLSEEERGFITSYAQLLSNMLRGISDQGYPQSISYTAARQEAETYGYYADRVNDAGFLCCIYIQGTMEGVSNLTQTLMRVFSGDPSTKTALRQLTLDPVAVGFTANPGTLPWIVAEETTATNDQLAQCRSNHSASMTARLPYFIGSEEAALLFHLPIGDETVGAGLTINESRHASRAFNTDVINSGDLVIGTIKTSARNDYVGMTLKDLTKHMLVTGTPGSGKTTFLIGMLDRLWKDHKIPFLIIEPAKNEFRALIQSIPDLQVFTPGKTDISPFMYNPFVPPTNVRLESFKPALLTAFAAAVSMSSPLDKIFEESLNNCYGDHHWFDSYTLGDGGDIFGISDFIRCFQNTFDTIGYTGDARNIGRAGTVRLKSLANLFDCYQCIPIEQILQKPTVIELSALESSDQKALIIALLLLAILCYMNANRVGDGRLQNIILLEEAHVLMDAESGNRSGEADPALIAQRLIIRMLAEIRSYGVGMVLADQSPRKVGADVIALTDAKLTFRLVEAADKQMIVDSTGLSTAQAARLSKLKAGEAMFFFGRLDEPEELRIPDYRLQKKISITLSDEEIRNKSTYWKQNAAKLRPYPECSYAPDCAATCISSTRAVAREVARRIHQKHLRGSEVSQSDVQRVLSRLNSMVREELRNETLTQQLYNCTIIHLIRLLRYNNEIVQTDDKGVKKQISIEPQTVDQIINRGKVTAGHE